MNAKQKLHQSKLNEWAAALADQKASGLTIRQWCAENQVSFHAYNYWKHLLKEEVVSQVLPDIIEVPLPETPQDIVPAPSVVPVSTEPIRTNRAIRAIRANDPIPTHSSGNASFVRLTLNDTVIEIPPDISSDLLCMILKAVRYV